MNRSISHPSDQELLQALDGELESGEARGIEHHLSACWGCRARKMELEKAIASFVRAYHGGLAAQIPPLDGPRAKLKAHLTEMAPKPSSPLDFVWRVANPRLAISAGVCFVLALGLWFANGVLENSADETAVTVPNPSLTPGAALLVESAALCREPNTKNKAVPVSLRREVFQAYGISRARPGAYEVDYLITPALGGADDVRNLWPQSYTNTEWNAEVKDILEDHLRRLVCAGEMDLTAAQHEIAMDWIESYKKHFHTDHPLEVRN